MEKRETSNMEKLGKEIVSKLEKLRLEVEKTESRDTLMKALGDISSLGEKTATSSSNPETLLWASEVQSRVAEVYKKASKVVVENPNFTQIRSLAEFFNTTADNWQNKAIASKQSVIDNSMRAAYDHLSKGEYWEALPYLERAIETNPENADAWASKGDALYGLGDFAEAIGCYDRVLRIDPDYVSALSYKGSALLNLGKREEALNWFDFVLSKEPNMELAHLGKGYAFYELRKFVDAKNEFEAALAINSESVEALDALGGLYYEVWQDYSHAIEFAERVLKIDPNFVPAKANLCEALLSGNDYERSIQLANEVLKANSEQFGYAMRLVIVCALYFQKKAVEAEAAALDLLEYFRAINRRIDIKWRFGGMKKTVMMKRSVQDSRRILLSLIELAESEDQTEKSIVARKLMDQLITPRAHRGRSFQKITQELQVTRRIQVKNTAEPDPKNPGYYSWEVFIVPQDALAKIASVTYTLHETFPDPVRTVAERETGFRLHGAGWGEFAIKVEVVFVDGAKTTKYHWLELGPTPPDSETQTCA